MRATVAIALIFAVLAGFSVWWMMPRPLPEVVICQSVVPGAKQVGLKFSRAAGGGIDVDFGGTTTTNAATAEALRAFLDCLEKQNNNKTINLVHGVRLDLEPIGQVAEHWKSDIGLRLKLMPGGEEKILNNLRIGPTVGSKQEVIRNWCSAEQAGNCVTCVPNEPTETTSAVEIQLRPNPPVEIIQMPGMWSGAAPGGRLEPWQLVSDGKRSLYVCKR